LFLPFLDLANTKLWQKKLNFFLISRSLAFFTASFLALQAMLFVSFMLTSVEFAHFAVVKISSNQNTNSTCVDLLLICRTTCC